jgi:protein phosphatase
MAQKLVEEGVIEKEEAKESRLSNVLWNVVGGGDKKVVVDMYKASLEERDTLLICTDGLTKHVELEEIVRILRQGVSAEDCCKSLVEAANADGGTDNITVVVARLGRKEQARRVGETEASLEGGVDMGSEPRELVDSRAESDDLTDSHI